MTTPDNSSSRARTAEHIRLRRKIDAVLHVAIEAADGRLKTLLDEIHGDLHGLAHSMGEQEAELELNDGRVWLRGGGYALPIGGQDWLVFRPDGTRLHQTVGREVVDFFAVNFNGPSDARHGASA